MPPGSPTVSPPAAWSNGIEDAGDRRVKRIGLTPAGAAARARLAACMESASSPLARLSAAERRQLHDLLLAAIGPDADLGEAQRQAARLLGSIELDLVSSTIDNQPSPGLNA